MSQSSAKPLEFTENSVEPGAGSHTHQQPSWAFLKEGQKVWSIISILAKKEKKRDRIRKKEKRGGIFVDLLPLIFALCRPVRF